MRRRDVATHNRMGNNTTKQPGGLPQVAKYMHLGWVETVMTGRGGAWTEWKEDRERLEGRLRRVIGMAGRIPYSCAEQLGEIMGMMMAGLIGYYGRGMPLDDATCK